MAEWTSAADRGDPDAEFGLGMLYERGDGELRQSYKEADRWYQKAADHDHVGAEYRLALIWSAGTDDFAADLVEAYKWILLASESGLATDVKAQLERVLDRRQMAEGAEARRQLERGARRQKGGAAAGSHDDDHSTSTAAIPPPRTTASLRGPPPPRRAANPAAAPAGRSRRCPAPSNSRRCRAHRAARLQHTAAAPAPTEHVDAGRLASALFSESCDVSHRRSTADPLSLAP